MRTWLIAAIAVAGIAAAALVFGTMNGGLPVEAANAALSPIREFVDERGKTRLPQVYNITMPFDGRIAAIELVEGAPVYNGQIVAKVVPYDLQLQVEAATAAVDRLNASIRENDDASVEKTGLEQSRRFVDSMQAAVAAAKARVEAGRVKREYADTNFERIRRLRQTGAKTEDEFDQARVQQVQANVDYQQDVLVLRGMEALEAATILMPTAVQQYIDRKLLTHEVLEKQRAEADVRLKEVQRDRDRGDLRSPVDGVVLERALSDEQRVAAGTVLMKIGRLEELEIEADILSQDVVNVKERDPVEITGPAIGPVPAHGTVKRIYPAGFTKVSSLGVEQQRVKVLIAIDPKDFVRLRKERDLGVDYRVRVRVFTAEKDDVLTVPRSALFRGGDGRWQVFVIRDGRARLQPVETGLMNDELVEIIAGLKRDEPVVLAPETSLKDGIRVKPIERQAALSGQPPDRD